MQDLKSKIQEAVNFIRTKTDLTPEVGIILGTGLGGLLKRVEIEIEIPYDDIPNFPVSTAPTHKGVLVFGKLNGREVVVMNGRVHYYEGYSLQEVTFPVRVMKFLGADNLIISSAVGGLNPKFERGDLVVNVDHINLMGDNPLIGPNDDSLGPRFPDMSEPYHRGYIKLLEQTALEEGIKINRGVLVAVSGPCLETAAEYRFLRFIGADTVGMSSVPEDIVAVHSGMRVIGLSIVTDMGLPDALKPADVGEIIAIANESGKLLEKIMVTVRQLMKKLLKLFLNSTKI